MSIYNKIAEYTTKGTSIVVVSVIEKNGDGPVEVGNKMIITSSDVQHGTVGGGALEYNARELCKSIFESRKSITKKYLLKEGKVLSDGETLPMECGGVVKLFFDYIGHKESIYLFGAGHVSQATTDILKTMNFHVTVIDERENVINKFTGGDNVVLAPYIDFIEKHGIKDNSFVIVCTPSHKHDYKVINRIIEDNIKVKYIGMICSHLKLQDFLVKTYERFGKEVDLSNFYSPIGLDLGGGSPAEIAISITSEILAISNNKKNHLHMREVQNHGKNRYWENE